MKLLDKQEINKLKAIERKREIDEGMKLAKKVDSLRKLAAEEEVHLKKFRDATLKEVMEQIDSLIREKNALEKEITEKRRDIEEKLKRANEYLKETILAKEESSRSIQTALRNLKATELFLKNKEIELAEREKYSTKK